MARKGYFGTLPSGATNLTGAIVSAIESYENRRDQLIYSAWLEGGTFEGEKVTDGRLLKWYKERRDQYSKDDPEWDRWNQSLQQRDYTIEEDKMLVKYAQGSVSDGQMGAWYSSQAASRFPRNSAAWREAMKNSANLQKKQQETSAASREQARLERYERSQEVVMRTKIRPAQQAQKLFNRILRRTYGVEGIEQLMQDEDNFRVGDEQIEAFLNTADGAKYARKWNNMFPGETFDLNAYRRVLQEGGRGYRQLTKNAKKHKYTPQATWGTAAIDYDRTASQVNTFRNDLYERQYIARENYENALEAAGDDVDAKTEARNAYAGELHSIERDAAKGGDDPTAAGFLQYRLALKGEGGAGEGGFEGELLTQRDADGKVSLDLGQYDGEADKARAEARWDMEQAEGMRAGTHMKLQNRDPVTGDLGYEIVPVEYFGEGPDTREFAIAETSLGPVPGTGLGAQSNILMAVKKRQVTFRVGGSDKSPTEFPGIFATHWEVEGVDQWEYANPLTGQLITSQIAPVELGGVYANPLTGTDEDLVMSREDVEGQHVVTLHPMAFTAIGTDSQGEDIAISDWFKLNGLTNQQLQGIQGEGELPYAGPGFQRPGSEAEGRFKRGDDESREDYVARLHEEHQKDVEQYDRRVGSDQMHPQVVASRRRIHGERPTDFDAWLERRGAGPFRPEEEQQRSEALETPEEPRQSPLEVAGLESTGPGAAEQSEELQTWLGRLDPGSQRALREAGVVSDETGTDRNIRIMPGVTREQLADAMADIPGTNDPEGTRAGVLNALSEEAFAPSVAAAPVAPEQSFEVGEVRPTEAQAEVAAVVADQTLLRKPTILSDSMFSYDRTGILMAAAANFSTRKEFAKQDEQQVMDYIIERNEWENNAEMQVAVARDIDAITASGQQGQNEMTYYQNTGSTGEIAANMGTVTALRAWQHNKEADSQVERLRDEGALARLDADYTEQELAQKFPDLLPEGLTGGPTDLDSLFAKGKTNLEQDIAGVGAAPEAGGSSLLATVARRGIDGFQTPTLDDGGPPTGIPTESTPPSLTPLTPKVDTPPPNFKATPVSPTVHKPNIAPLPSGRARVAPLPVFTPGSPAAAASMQNGIAQMPRFGPTRPVTSQNRRGGQPL